LPSGVRSALRNFVACLPWGARKLVAFIALHSPSGLLLSRPSFVGTYKSFADAPPSRQTSAEYLVEEADLHLRAQKFDQATGFPLLRNSHSLLPLAVAMLAAGKSVRVLDVGGAAGVDFANVLSGTSRQNKIQYRVIDRPEVCALGRSRWHTDPRISFGDTMPSDGEEFDLIYSSWTLQYFPDPLASLKKLAAYNAKVILLINIPFTSKISFVRTQVNKGVPSWVLSLSDVQQVMRESGYELAFHAAGDIDHNVDNYQPEYRVSNGANLLFLRCQ
jgi:putative methyltransferase (TIGR04325 family)